MIGYMRKKNVSGSCGVSSGREDSGAERRSLTGCVQVKSFNILTLSLQIRGKFKKGAFHASKANWWKLLLKKNAYEKNSRKKNSYKLQAEPALRNEWKQIKLKLGLKNSSSCVPRAENGDERIQHRLNKLWSKTKSCNVCSITPSFSRFCSNFSFSFFVFSCFCSSVFSFSFLLLRLLFLHFGKIDIHWEMIIILFSLLPSRIISGNSLLRQFT